MPPDSYLRAIPALGFEGALPEGTPVYLDESLRRFETVFPAAGSASSAAEMTCEELFRASRAMKWVDVCKE